MSESPEGVIKELQKQYAGPGDPRFHAILREMGALHDKKQADYGTPGDPFANVRASEDWGIPGWIGGLVRANDKMKRLKNFARKGALHNESAEDSMIDIAVYAIISLVLYREAGVPGRYVPERDTREPSGEDLLLEKAQSLREKGNW